MIRITEENLRKALIPIVNSTWRLREWQKCPICEGVGTISANHGYTSSLTEPCPTCHGARIILKPALIPPEAQRLWEAWSWLRGAWEWLNKQPGTGSRQYADQIEQYLESIGNLPPAAPAALSREDALREALVACALPYEAILMDKPTQRWLAPGIWASIEAAVKKARAALATVKAEGQTVCGKPCPPDSPCEECEGYWQRMVMEGLWDEKEHRWTEKGIQLVTVYLCENHITDQERRDFIAKALRRNPKGRGV